MEVMGGRSSVAGEDQHKSWSSRREYLRITSRSSSSSSSGGRNNNNNQKAAVIGNILDAIAAIRSAGGGGGKVVCESDANGAVVTRMKILVKKEDLKQVLQIMRNDAGGKSTIINASPASAMSSLEQRLSIMRKRQMILMGSSRNNNIGQLRRSSSNCCWRPMLQSIPEEDLQFFNIN